MKLFKEQIDFTVHAEHAKNASNSSLTYNNSSSIFDKEQSTSV